tara:strand:+ start:1098 stop:1442 length:345 start_codon:yes stop_codon:yes gene_type:complete
MSLKESNLKDLTMKYINMFINKDINGLSNIFDDSIVLRDWETMAEGKESVLSANENIFNSLASINIEILGIIAENKRVSVEFTLAINETEKINIVDLIDFTDSGKILLIKAYRG